MLNIVHDNSARSELGEQNPHSDSLYVTLNSKKAHGDYF